VSANADGADTGYYLHRRTVDLGVCTENYLYRQSTLFRPAVDEATVPSQQR